MTNATTTTQNLSDALIVGDNLGSTAGRIVTWRTGGRVNIADFEAAVRIAFEMDDDEEFVRGDLPRRPSVSDALRRVAKDMALGRDKGVHADPKGGYCVVRKRETEDAELDFRQTIRVDYDRETGRAFQDIGDGPDYSDELNARFDRIRNEYNAEDFQRWIPTLMTGQLSGVNCRDGGGFVFVPAECVPALDTWNRVIRETTECKLYSNPAGRGGDFLEMAMDGIASEATQALKRSEAPDGAGKRALVSSNAAVDAVAAKLARYEKILDRKLPELTKLASEAKRAVAVRMIEEGEA